MSSQIVRFDTLRSIAYSSIGATYTQVGTGIGHQVRILKFVNNTNADIIVSFDGINDNDFIAANSFSLYDFQTDAKANYLFNLQSGSGVLVKYNSSPPTQNSFYIVAIYGRGE